MRYHRPQDGHRGRDRADTRGTSGLAPAGTAAQFAAGLSSRRSRGPLASRGRAAAFTEGREDRNRLGIGPTFQHGISLAGGRDTSSIFTVNTALLAGALDVRDRQLSESDEVPAADLPIVRTAGTAEPTTLFNIYRRASINRYGGTSRFHNARRLGGSDTGGRLRAVAPG